MGRKSTVLYGKDKVRSLEVSLSFDVEGTSCYVEGGLRKLVKVVKLVNLDKSMVKLYVQ